MVYKELQVLRCLLLLLVLQSFFLCAYAQNSLLSPTSDMGYIFLDKEDVSIKIFDANGNMSYRYGGWGLDSEYSFDKPVHLYTQSGLKIFVTDIGQKNIKAFDKRLQLIAIYEVDEISPVASSLIDGEQLLVMDKSLDEWLIIDTRFNTKQLIRINIAENLVVDNSKEPLLTDSRILIPVRENHTKVQKNDSINYNYLSYSHVGVFKSWLILPSNINAYSKEDSGPMMVVSDGFIYKISSGLTRDFEQIHAKVKEKIVWISSTEYAYLKDSKLIIERINAIREAD